MYVMLYAFFRFSTTSISHKKTKKFMWLDSSNNHFKAAPVTIVAKFSFIFLVRYGVVCHGLQGTFMVENGAYETNKKVERKLERPFFANGSRE